MQKFVLLDRDGVINARPGSGWVTHWRKFRFLPRAIEALRNLSRCGYKSIVISNQSGVGRGLFSEEELKKIRKRHTKQFGDTSSISLAGLRRLDDNSAYEMVTTL